MTNYEAWFPHNANNRIDPTAIIGSEVRMGKRNIIGPYAVITGRVELGDGNWIAPHVSIGTPAEWPGRALPVTWENEHGEGRVAIGDFNVIREFVTINAGTEHATRIGNGCYLMARCHLGHDAVVDNAVTMAPASQLGGWTNVWPWAFLGLGCQIHQWGVVGPGAMVGMNAAVTARVEPFTTVVGVPARPIGINRVGLRRRGVPEDVIDEYARNMAKPPAGLPPAVLDVLDEWRKKTA